MEIVSGYSNVGEMAVDLPQPKQEYAYTAINRTPHKKDTRGKKERKEGPQIYATLKQSEVEMREYTEMQTLHPRQESRGTRKDLKAKMTPTSLACKLLPACFVIILLVWVVVSMVLMLVIRSEIKSLQTTCKNIGSKASSEEDNQSMLNYSRQDNRPYWWSKCKSFNELIQQISTHDDKIMREIQKIKNCTGKK